jgi:hypothetical protein
VRQWAVVTLTLHPLMGQAYGFEAANVVRMTIEIECPSRLMVIGNANNCSGKARLDVVEGSQGH